MRQYEETLTDFDTIIHNIFDFDVETVVNDCVSIFSNHFFTAHLLDILYMNGKLQLNKPPVSQMSNEMITTNASQIYQQHLYCYCEELFQASTSTFSLFETAIDYLLINNKNNNNKANIESNTRLIETCLQKYDIKNSNEFEINRIYNLVAFKLNLHDLAHSIGRTMQLRAFKRAQYGLALGWNLRIRDSSFGDILGDKVCSFFFIFFFLLFSNSISSFNFYFLK
jgi:hypothetical protein